MSQSTHSRYLNTCLLQIFNIKKLLYISGINDHRTEQDIYKNFTIYYEDSIMDNHLICSIFIMTFLLESSSLQLHMNIWDAGIRKKNQDLIAIDMQLKFQITYLIKFKNIWFQCITLETCFNKILDLHPNRKRQTFNILPRTNCTSISALN